ncbi:MAG: hypothetical protein IKP47_04155 [Ruminococcus sp.]|nr:hypothetical protein [Ruminococcus sp.]
MRSDAIRRMREMQKRALNAGHTPPPPQREAPPPAQRGGLGDMLSSVLGQGQRGLFDLGGIAIDEEKAMIALLIYILYKQGSDIRLLLALGYLLL